jgi:urease accessory protein
MDSTILIVAAPDRLPRIECRGALTARSTLPDTVHLVSAAATPLGGDTITMHVVVEAGARLSLRSVAATVALPGRNTDTSHADVLLDIAGHLDMDLEPTVVAAAAHHHTTVRAAIEEAGALRFRERVQIGRTGEGQGFWSGSMRADVKGRPLLRHRIELGTGSVTDDVLGAPRAMVSELRYPDSADPGDLPGTVLQLADGGVISTWQGARLDPNYAGSAV